MKEIKVLGTGCPKCKKLEEVTRLVAEDMKIEFNLEKVTDLNEIMDFGVMMTPALVVDGEVKVAGKIPAIKDLKTMLL
ncbi:MAG: TM0996/MTH895 family glutaredoxin-like protein [Candidatus Aminicenantes bacterium]|nr:TM0996/MTH895 family glutaredoxin-like protein [Candidatus Aminicenantes bacterium]MCK5003875.1 TM0996/MTH895 family glutaredoxin-like protein [Candidatus Aminicenantes bacterium]